MTTEKLLTCAQAGKKMGVSEEFVRSACHRGKDYHPMPHLRYGKNRQYIRVHLSKALQWLDEEMEREAGLA
jgi:hypothetical protein